MISLIVLFAVVGAEEPVNGVHWSPIVDAFGEFGARFPTGAAASNAFSIPRVQGGAEIEWRGARARLLLEGAYASQGGALLGVSGDSVTVRVREAWAGYRFHFLEAQLGIVPTLLVPELERAFLYRELTADGHERFRIQAPADFGGVLRGYLPKGYGFVGVSITNGEGYTQRELNPGKNFELVAAVHPLPSTRFEPLTAVVNATFGSTGPAASTANRFGGALLWQAPRLGGGVTVTSVHGWQDDATRRALLTQGFARIELFERLLLAARIQYFVRNLSSADTSLELLAGVGVKAEFVEVFAVVSRTSLSSLARAALPGVEATEARLVVRARWPGLYAEEKIP